MQLNFFRAVVWLGAVGVAVGLMGACMGGSSGGRCARAVAGCGCYPNGTCESGYTCGGDDVCTGASNDEDASVTNGNGSQCDAPSACLDAGTASGGAGSGNGGTAGNTAIAGSGGVVGAGGVPAGGAGGTGGASAGSGGQGGSSAGAGGAGGAAGGSGGAAGTGGQSAANCGETTMIDDFEDGDDNLCQHDGRTGQWYVYTNGGTITPAGSPVNPQQLDPAQGGSTRAMHFVSAGGDDFSRPSIGFSLVGIGAAAQPFDASMYSGIRFQGSSGVLEDFDLLVQTTSTETIASGGACVSDCAPNEAYSPFFGNGWNEYDFTWDQFFGGNVSVNPAELRSITFQFRNAVDLWIDDIEFF